ncbi:GntR family transcriptional regulator [Sphingomonas flavalba]|uniref:GntR family transcriptional regulator n=1 Tax=Sphingomonas flavalba TaxID=2559804 RepID=UPI00109D9959|nr:GntR family transcriptional regulator [Sphingomonas flavalba]
MHDAGEGDSGRIQTTEKLERSTTSADVARVLRRRILEGRYGEEQFIRQDVIATELGVSRIPVREALAQLESEGLVIREKYRGAIVPKLSLSEIEEIYELRGMIEPYLLAHAISNITPRQVRQLREIITRSMATDLVADWAGLNVDFHRKLYEVAGKPLTLQVLDNLLIRADRYLKLQNFNSLATKNESDAEHARILDLVEKRDVKAATAALRTHIRWNAEDVRQSIAPGRATKTG